MTNPTRSLFALAVVLSLATAGCGAKGPPDLKALEARLVQIKDEVCACTTQRCAQDAKGKAERVQMQYSKQVKSDPIPQTVIDNYEATQTCYREVNEGKR